MTIRAGFVFDGYGDEGAWMDEVEGAIIELNDIAGLGMSTGNTLDINAVLKTGALRSADLREKYDLLVIDYGGMSTTGAEGSAISQIDAVCTYADMHPGTLVIIWTGYTADVYLNQVAPNFEGLDNVVCRYMSVMESMTESGDPEFVEKFRNWFANEINAAKVTAQ